MTVHKSVLTKCEEIAEGTMAFYFDRPPGFEFKAGQSIDLTLIDPPETDFEGDTRVFSVASSPHDAHLMIATRMRDTAFKRVLRKMAIGNRGRHRRASWFLYAAPESGETAVLLARIGSRSSASSSTRHRGNYRTPCTCSTPIEDRKMPPFSLRFKRWRNRIQTSASSPP